MSIEVGEKLRVAVTGGAGRIGTAIARALIDRGHEVIRLDRRHPEQTFGKFVFCDLRNRETVQPVFEQCNAVVHLGEIPHLIGGVTPEIVYLENAAVGGTVMQTAADLKIRRLIYTSTCQTYGAWGYPWAPPQHVPFDETMPLRPQNAYAASKVANEAYSRSLADTHPDLSVTVFRLPYVIMEVTEKMRRWMSLEWQQQVQGPVEGFGTYVHIADVVRAYVAALEKGESGWEAYHLSAANVRLRMGLHEYMQAHFPTWPRFPSDWPDYKSPLILTKAQTRLGWEPQWDFRQLQAAAKE